MSTQLKPDLSATHLLKLGAFSAALLLTSLTAVVSTAHAAPSQTMSGSDSVVGMRVDDFELVDHTGTAHRLYYYNNSPAIVLMTQGNGCPIVRNAMPEFRAVRDDYASKNIPFFLLNSNIQDNRDSIAAEVENFGYDIPVLVDTHQLVGESLNVSRTAEIYVIDPISKKVVYHGPVSDKVTYEVQKEKAASNYLANALDSIIAGKKIAVADVDAPGCLINFPENENRDQHAEISYHDTIAPLLEKNCIGCHQEGGIGPWAMTSYEMIKGFSPMIREVIRTDRMPPWHADPEVGHFLRDKSLSANEIKTLVHWIEAGSPRGEGPDPLAVPRAPLKDWPLGKPDMIVALPSATIPATGIVDYRYPVIENPLKESKWLKASTVKVGSRETVHHVLSGFMKEMPKDGESGQIDWGPSVGGYAVGAESQISREGMGTYIPAGGAIGFQMHYTTYGKEVTDTTEIGLYFYDDDKKPKLMIRNMNIADISIKIPPNTARHEEIAYLEFPQDAELLFAFPHAHYRGQASKLSIRYPDGKEELLLSLPRYDFNWQRSYEFAEPIQIPAGSKLISINVYDNTRNNPANPDPSETIYWGEQSHEEMLFTAVSYRWKDETTDNIKDEYQQELGNTRLFGMLDDNVNDKLEREELKGRPGKMIADSFSRLDRDGDGAINHEEFTAVAAMMAQR
ncbi:MAG: redoxin domain-containing protein [Oceanicoccus sp.]